LGLAFDVITVRSRLGCVLWVIFGINALRTCNVTAVAAVAVAATGDPRWAKCILWPDLRRSWIVIVGPKAISLCR
jgi:hypothetical protein